MTNFDYLNSANRCYYAMMDSLKSLFEYKCMLPPYIEYASNEKSVT